MSLKAVQKLSPTLAIEVTADNPKDLIEELAFFSELPKACPICGAGVGFTHRTPKGFNFYGLLCDGTPQHESTFGQHKDGGGLFYKNSEPWEEVRRGRNQDDDEYPQEPEPHQRTQQSMRGAEQGQSYGQHTGARQENPTPADADGPCPRCHAPFGKPHGKPCTQSNAYRSH
jgi:hypothetical protein